VDVATNPAMPVMADGLALGEGPLRIRVQRLALAVMVGEPAPEVLPSQGVILDDSTGESTQRKDIA